MKKSFVIFSLISISIVFLIVYLMFNIQEKKVNREIKEHNSLITKIDIKDQPFIGDSNAPITIVEFFDLKCPSCSQWKKSIFPILKKKYVDTKKAKIVFINTPLKQHGDDAYFGALALESAYKQNSDFFMLLLDELFNKQQSIEKKWITNDLIVELGNKINNLNVDHLITGISNKEIKENVEKDLQIARNANLDSTPTIFINNIRVESVINTENGKKINSNPFDLVKIDNMIKKELEKLNE